MKVLEKMLEIEAEAQRIVDNAKLEANSIREKAREEAKQRIIDGKRELQERVQKEVKQIEAEAAEQKASILKETEIRLAEMERLARERIDSTVDHVFKMILEI